MSRKGRNTRIVIGFVAVIAIVIGIVMFTPIDFSGLILGEVSTTIEQTFGYHGITPLAFICTGTNCALDERALCTFESSIDARLENGDLIEFSSSSPTPASIVGQLLTVTGTQTGSEKITLLIPDLEIVCSNQQGASSMRVASGSKVDYIWETRDRFGATRGIKSGSLTIPTGQELIARNTQLPSRSATVSDTEIENVVNLQAGDLIGKTVPVTVTFYPEIFVEVNGIQGSQFESRITSSWADGVYSSNWVRVTNDELISPTSPTTQGSKVEITLIKPNQFNYYGNEKSTLSPTSGELGTNSRITFSVTGVLDNWTSAEGIPTVQVKTPKGQVIVAPTPMSSQTPKALANGDTEFKKINLVVPVQITDNVISTLRGQWTVEMISNQNIRQVTDVKTFTLNDARTMSTPTNPDEGTGGGTTTPTPTEPICPFGSTNTQVQAGANSATNQEIIDVGRQLGQKVDQGIVFTACENFHAFWINVELQERGLSLEEQQITSAPVVSKILFDIRHAPTDQSPNGCTDADEIPRGGIPVIGFELQSIGQSTCQGSQFVETTLTPVVDISGDTGSFRILTQDIGIKESFDIFVNSPLPDVPLVVTGDRSGSTLPTCTIKNYDQTRGRVDNVPFRIPSQAGTSGLSSDNLVRLARVNYGFDDILNPINSANSGISLKEGDIVSVVYTINGKFTGSKDNAPITGIVDCMAFTQEFTYSESGEGNPMSKTRTCDPDTEVRSADGLSCEPNPKLLTQADCDKLTEEIGVPFVLQNGMCIDQQDGSSKCSDSSTLQCSADEEPRSTGEVDACQRVVIECVPKVQVQEEDEEETPMQQTPSDCKEGEAFNQITKRCVSINTKEDPNGGGGSNSGYCEGNFDLAECARELTEDLPFLQIVGGATGAFMILAVLVIGIIIFGVIRRRRG